MSFDWLCIAMVAVFWGGYPLLTRLSSLSAPIATLVLATVALVPIGAAALWSGWGARPTLAQLWPVVVAGLMQGIGLLAFVQIASSRRLEASVSIPIADVSMLIVTAVGAIALFHEAVTLQKLVGVGLLVVGIVLLRPT